MTTQLAQTTPAHSPHTDPMTPYPVRIQRILWETDDTFTLTLDMSTYSLPFKFTPGQFNMLYAFGIGEAAISISSDPSKTATLVHTIHRVGVVTSALSQLRRGDIIGLRGPYGNSWPIEIMKKRDVVIMAGGIGLAPLRPVLYHVLRNRSDYGRVILLYGARSPLDLLYRVELEQWSKQPNIEVLVTVDKGDSTWKGNISVVTKLLGSIKLDTANTIALVCGPEVMMKYGAEDIERVGLESNQIYVSMERNMKCGYGQCGHCQFGPIFICKDGPVFPYIRIRDMLEKKEI